MMDFLDPKKSRAYTVRLYVGYVLLAVAIVLATVVLLYQAGGYGVDSQGNVIQNGLVYVSSAPSGAQIYLNGQRSDTTNTRLALPSGTYSLRLTRDGYRDWQRALTIEGGSVEHVDYPLLFPKTLQPAALADYPAEPPLATESPDRRWLLVQQPSSASFDIYDLKDPKKVKALKASVAIPDGLLALGSQPDQQQYTVAEWSRDNDHLLLRHSVGQQSEYILLSRSKPETSLNLTKQLQLKPEDQLAMRDKKYDRYFVHDTAAKTLSTLNLDGQPAKLLLNGVLSYKSYGDNVVLYATTDGAEAGKVAVKLYQSDAVYPVRQVAAAGSYLLDLSTYGGDWYIVAGSPAEDHVYIYQNPAQHLQDNPALPLVPVSALKLAAPNYLEFSANSQMVMVENGQNFAVYDVLNERSFSYAIDKPLDAPQLHATWMDGFHLTLVSGAAATVFDYDGTNLQGLTAAVPAVTPYFDTAYQNLYTLAPVVAAAPDAAAGGKQPGFQLDATPLRTERDR